MDHGPLLSRRAGATKVAAGGILATLGDAMTL
jgi:hypothetical protein